MLKWVIAVALGTAIGCDNSETDGAKGAQSGSRTSQTSPEVDTSTALPGAATPGTTRPGEVTASAVIDAQRQATNNPAVTAATQPGAGQQVQEQAANQGTQVQSQIDQALQYVKEKKYDLAEKILNTLDQQRSGWSTATQQTYGPKIDMAKQALTAAKGGSGALDQLRGTAFPSNTTK